MLPKRLNIFFWHYFSLRFKQAFFLHCTSLWSGYSYICQIVPGYYAFFFQFWNCIHILGLSSEIFWSNIVDTLLGKCFHPGIWCAPVNRGQARGRAGCHLPSCLLQTDKSLFPFSDLKCKQSSPLVPTGLFILESYCWNVPSLSAQSPLHSHSFYKVMFIVYFGFCLYLFFMRTGSYSDPSRAWVTVEVVCISSWTLEKRENVILIKPRLTDIMPLNNGSQRLFSLHKCKEPDGISRFYYRMNVRVFGVGFSNVARIGILGYATLSLIDKKSILVNPRDFWQMQFWEYRQNGHDKEGT